MTPSEHFDRAESKMENAFDALPPAPQTLTANALAGRLGWSVARARWALVELRDIGRVAYEPGCRGWSRRS
jgi:hypothetical protein